MPIGDWDHKERHQDSIARTAVVDMARAADFDDDNIRYIDYSTSAYRIFRALEAAIERLDIDVDAEELFDHLVKEHIPTALKTVSFQPPGGHPEDVARGVSIADRNTWLRRMGKLTKADLDALVTSMKNSATNTGLLTGRAVAQKIVAPIHFVEFLVKLDSLTVSFYLSGSGLHKKDNHSLSVYKNNTLLISSGQINELGCYIPKQDLTGEDTDDTLVVLTLTPTLPDDKFLRVRSMDLETVSTHNLRQKDATLELTYADLKKTGYRLMIEDREKKKKQE